LRSLCPIPSGTQITIGYIDIGAPRADRQKKLRSKYNFACVCSSCSLPVPESELSDRNRRQIEFLRSSLKVGNEERLKQWLKDPTRSDNDTIRDYEEVWEVMESEQCHDQGVWPVVVQSLCKIHCALGNVEEAKKWAQVGMTFSLVFTNDEGGWREVYEAPERTAWWGLRKAFKK
jgi:hypothetical protein